MIDRRPHHRHAHGDVYARLDAEDFDRAMALVVIHGHHETREIYGAELRKNQQRDARLYVKAP